MKSTAIVCTALLAAATLSDAHPGHGADGPRHAKAPKNMRIELMGGGVPPLDNHGLPSGVNGPRGKVEDLLVEKDCGVEDDSDEAVAPDSPAPLSKKARVEVSRLGSPYDDNAPVEKVAKSDHSFDFNTIKEGFLKVFNPIVDAANDMGAKLGNPYSKDSPVVVAVENEERLAVEPESGELGSAPAIDAGNAPPAVASAGGNSTDGFTLHALAIGDWGVGGSSCCSKYKRRGEAKYRDQQAQRNIAHLMSLSADRLKPKAVLGHGDNFYWNGVGRDDVAQRFLNTFEEVYDQPSLLDVEWMNVMGNHDYGGAAYICGTGDGAYRPCTSIEEMEAALDEKFTLQSQYKSHNNDRWKMPGHYYKKTLQCEQTGMTVDFYNVDTNAATNHGAEQVCCQCYGYQNGKKPSDPGYINCNTVHRGHEMCFGGNTDMFDACMAKFKGWTDDSLKQLAKDSKASKADWKIVNSHYSPHFHMPEPMMNAWNKVLAEGNVQVFLNGHTHAEGIDFANFNVHFVTNGAGGGIQTEAVGDVPPTAKGIKKVWRAKGDPYGYFEISFSPEALRLQLVTFDDQWKFAKKRRATVKGGAKVDYCYLIPKDGGIGRPCDGY